MLCFDRREQVGFRNVLKRHDWPKTEEGKNDKATWEKRNIIDDLESLEKKRRRLRDDIVRLGTMLLRGNGSTERSVSSLRRLPARPEKRELGAAVRSLSFQLHVSGDVLWAATAWVSRSIRGSVGLAS